MRTFKTKREYKESLNSLIVEYSKIDKRVKKIKIDIEKYCIDKVYRWNIDYKIKHYKQVKENWVRHNNSEEGKARIKERKENNIERRREIHRNGVERYIERHPEYRKKCARSFQRWIINNPRKAMICAAASQMTRAVVNKLGIRPTVCPHCGRKTPNIDFHHPNHLFRWKGTFCCKSCHYYFNRDKVPTSDKIIDLKKLLRESISH